MIELYTGQELAEAKAKRKKYIWIIIIATFLLIALNAAIVIWRYNLPYDPNGSDFLQQVLSFTVTLAYLWFMTYFIGLPFRMCRGYIKMYSAINRGENNPIEAIFLGIDEAKTTIDGVDFYSMLFYEGLNKKGRDIIGRVYLDVTKEVDMEIGDKVLYCQKGSVLCSYEIIQKEAASLEDIENMIESLKQHVDMDVVMIVEEIKKKGIHRLEDMEIRDDVDLVEESQTGEDSDTIEDETEKSEE